MQPSQLLISIPAVLFALGGVLLWRRHRSVPTLLIALGFVAMFVGEVASLVVARNIELTLRANPSADVIHHHHIVPVLVHYLPLCGLWAAAVGLVWHASVKR